MSRTLSQGMTGQDVRALQDVLNFHIRRGEALKVDGIFGPKTHARVLEFQKVNGLQVDGLVGPRTEGQLFEVTELPLPIPFITRLHRGHTQKTGTGRCSGTHLTLVLSAGSASHRLENGP